MRRLMVAATSVVSLMAIGCGSTSGSDAAVPDDLTSVVADMTMTTVNDLTATASNTAAIQIKDNFYLPANVSVTKGGTVTWTWAGANPHTVTSGTGGVADGKFCNDVATPTMTACNVSTNSKATGTFAFTFAASGSYPYFCKVHGVSMSGTVTVP